MTLIRQHLQAGKPLAGIRTASHAFGASPKDEQHENWLNFDVDVLGCHYENHYNNNAGTRVAVSGPLDHPVLSGMPTNEFRVTSSLYRSRNPSSAVTVLMTGRVDGQSGTEPVAWVNTAEQRRVFYTSLGNPEDFQQEFFRRLLLNGILWSLNKPTNL